MTLAILNQYSVGQLAIAVVVAAAVVALVFVALKQFGVSTPDWVSKILWIIVVAIVVILAIRFVTSL